MFDFYQINQELILYNHLKYKMSSLNRFGHSHVNEQDVFVLNKSIDTNVTNTELQVSDPSLEVTLGNIPGQEVIFLNALNPVVTTGSQVVVETVVTVPPTSAVQHNISSSAAEDDIGGTGALTILIEGLDDTYTELQETIILTGAIDVLTVNSYRRINKMSVTSAGTFKRNIGIISAIAVGPATLTISIAPNSSRSESIFYSVPLGKTAYIVDIESMVFNNTANTFCEFSIRLDVDVLSSPISIVLDRWINRTNSITKKTYKYYRTIQTQSDLYIEAASRINSNSEVYVTMVLLIIDD